MIISIKCQCSIFLVLYLQQSNNSLSLNTPLTISDSLIFVKGIINADTTNFITMNNGGKISGASDSSFVNGPFIKVGNASFVFPVGFNGSNGYHPIEMTAPVSSSDSYTAQYMHSGQTFGNALDSTIEHLSTCQYWKLIRNSGSSKVRVKLSWNNHSCGIINPQYMRIAGWNGSKWVDFKSYAYAGDSIKGSTTSLDSANTIGIFTHSNKRCIYFADVLTKHDVYCVGNDDGVATVQVSGGTPPYSYIWSNSMGTQATTPNILYAGNYVVSISDALNCHLSDTAAIHNPDSMHVSFEISPSACGDSAGTAAVLVTGGTGVNKKFYWTQDGTTSNYHDHLPAGNYTVLVTDSAGCSNFAEFNLSDNNGPAVSENYMTPATCFGGIDGALKVNASGNDPFIFKWSSSDYDTLDEITGRRAGDYTIMVKDNNGCITYDTFQIAQPDTFRVTVTTTDTRCGDNNGTATATVIGGTAEYQYAWSNSGTTESTLSGLASGEGTVTVTDANGCTTASSFEILNTNGITVTGYVISNAICFPDSGGSARVVVSNGTPPYTYKWFPQGGENDTAYNLPPDNYSITVTDANGCRQKGEVVIASPEELKVEINRYQSDNDENNEGVAFATALGGTSPYSYFWNDSTTASSINKLNYYDTISVVVTDSHGCTSSRSNIPPLGPAPHSCGNFNTVTNLDLIIPNCPAGNCMDVTMNIVSDFGANGNDPFSDELAFESAASFFQSLNPNALKTLIIPQGTYYVGMQTTGYTFWLTGHNVLQFYQINNLTIKGDVDANHVPISIIKFKDCMKYGAFDPSTGQRYITSTNIDCWPTALTINNYNQLANYGDLINLNYCNNVNIKDLELDGNIDNAIIGGGYSAGIQLSYNGIRINGSKNVTLENLKVHHFGLDGLWVSENWCPPAAYNTVYSPINLIINKCNFYYSSRNNMSWTGASGISVIESFFNNAGQGRFVSDPGSGLDIEIESPVPISNGNFYKCAFQYDIHWGLDEQAHTYHIKNCFFNKCNFTGSFFSAQFASYGFNFTKCQFVGEVSSQCDAAITNSTSINNYQTRFIDCYFDEETIVPEFITSSDNGRRSFEMTSIETGLTGSNCPVPGHRYLLNALGSRQELTNCIFNSNYTMKNVYAIGGSPLLYNGIKMTNNKMNNHGLNGCGCEHELSAYRNVNFLGTGNGELISQYPGLRNSGLSCSTSLFYFGGVDWGHCSGTFNPAYCCIPERDTLSKYIHLLDPNPVTLFFTLSTEPCTSITSLGIQSNCFPLLKRRKEKEQINEEHYFSITPNPSHNKILVSNLISDEKVTLINILGNIVSTKSAIDGIIEYDISNLSSGLYFLRSNSGKSGKFIKQ